jgi:hypothetical protein
MFADANAPTCPGLAGEKACAVTIAGDSARDAEAVSTPFSAQLVSLLTKLPVMEHCVNVDAKGSVVAPVGDVRTPNIPASPHRKGPEYRMICFSNDINSC